MVTVVAREGVGGKLLYSHHVTKKEPPTVTSGESGHEVLISHQPSSEALKSLVCKQLFVKSLGGRF